jgi:hypothetical protein
MCRLAAIALVLAVVGTAGRAGAGEIGHFSGGLLNVRDLAMPEPGFYVAIYNLVYDTDQVNDRHGDEIDRLTLVGPRGRRRLTLDLDVDVQLYGFSPALMWVSDWKILGGRYAAFIAPTFANSSISAALSASTGRGVDADTGQFGIGDLFVQPIWLGWGFAHFDVGLSGGFYAPIGKYDVETVRLPRLGAIELEATDNIGYGFWTGQAQAAGYWYPWTNKATAVGLALTYEAHGKKEDFDLRPGMNLTLNWGVDQYLPLNATQTLLADLGVLGYSSWQITDDDGDDVRQPTTHDEVHAAGLQVGLSYVPWSLALVFHWAYEFAAQDRFAGQAYVLTLGKKF